MDRFRLGPILYSLLLTAGLVNADVVLFDHRVDLDQKTEIRFDAPDGCVITGLGFRAHYDNVTTMLCRYHHLSGEGVLADPCEVRLGSEADHACEATVMLPQGYVAVGFGAAGEPEWDVTVLHVWARKLASDGSLGPVEQFSDGFNPTRSSEDQFILALSDRALTGAGARFAFNNVSGLYAASKRITAVTGADREMIAAFKESIWVLRAPRSIHPDVLAEAIGRLGPTRVDLCCDSRALANPDLLGWHDRQASIAREHQSRCFVWLATTEPGAIETVRARVKSLDGIVLDTAGIPASQLSTAAVAAMHRACADAGLGFEIRLDPAEVESFAAGARVLASLADEVGVIVRRAQLTADAGPMTPCDLSKFAGRRLFVEFDLLGDEACRLAYPDIRINELPGLVYDASLSDARGFVTPVNIVGGFLPTSINGLNLQALHRLARDPFAPIDGLWTDLCGSRYGSAAAGKAVSALKRTAVANNLIFTTLGAPVVRYDGRFHRCGDIQRRITHLLEGPMRLAHEDALLDLLNPTDKTASRASGARETALWLLVQSKSEAEAAYEARPSAGAAELLSSISRLQQAARYMGDADQAYLRTKIYSIDGAQSTRDQALAALERMRKSELAVTPLAAGADGFADSINKALARARQSAALTVAFDKVSEAARAGESEQAATAFAEILNDPVLSRHLTKRWEDVGRAASMLSMLGETAGRLNLLWGADGQWMIEKVQGRWCCVIGKGRPCLYLNEKEGKLETPGEYVVEFEYLDRGDWTLHFEYDSDYPDSERRQYHPVEPLQLTDTGRWKKGSFVMDRCLFLSGQNLAADMRFVTGQGACIRNIRLKSK